MKLITTMAEWTVLVVGVLMALFLVTVLATAAEAKTLTISWTGDAAATAYSIYKSTDQGVTWTKIKDVTAGTSTAMSTTLTTPTDLPDNALVLLRLSAKNAQGEAIRTEVGIWVQTGWIIPAQPQQVGVQ